MYRFNRAVFLCCVILTACMTSLAQSKNGAIVIDVIDPFRNIVTGGDVEIIDSQKAKTLVKTNDDGVAEFRRLETGVYQITVIVPGFKEYKNEIILKASEVKRLEIMLELAGIETQVNVDEKESLDMDNYGVTKELSQQQIDELPDNPDDLRRVIQRLAGESVTGEELPINVNGIPGAPLPSKENIKLIRVNRNVFSAQYENTFGGGIEIITGIDAKKISGYGGFQFSDSRLNAPDPFLGRRIPSQNRYFYFGARGPLRKGMALYMRGSFSNNDTSSVVNAVVLDPNLQIVDFRQTFRTPSRSNSIDLTLDMEPNKKHKVFLNYRFDANHGKNSGIGGLNLLERGTNTSSTTSFLSLSDTYIINPNFVNTTRFFGRMTKSKSIGDIDSPSITVSESFLGGSSQTDQSQTNIRYEAYNDTTRKIGRLSIGFGGMFRGYHLSDVSRSNFGGSYTFTGRIAPVLDSNYEPVRDSAGNILTERISSIESYRRTLLLRGLGFSPAAIRVRGGGADQLSIAGGIPDINVSQFDYAIYQQNSFGIGETLGLSFGVRYENQTNLDSRLNLSPRIGLIYAPKIKEKQSPISQLPRVTVGYGMFYSRFAINSILSERQANSTERAFYFITDPQILDSFPLPPSTDTLQLGATLRSLRLIDAGLQSPLLNLFNVNVTKKLWGNFTMNATYSRSYGYRQALTRSINAPLAGTLASPVYPFGNSRSIYETRSEGRYVNDRISVNLSLPQWKLFGQSPYGSFNYSYSKSSGNVASGSSSPLDPYDFSREWGPNSFDGVHALFGYFGMGLPRGFYLYGDLSYRTGGRFNIITGRDTNKDGFYSERPAFASDPNKPGVVQTPYGALDPNPTAADRIIPRNLGRGPATADFNLGLSKSFGFDEDKANKNAPRKRLNYSVTLNNVLNINNKSNPIGNMSSTNFLRSIDSFSFDGSSGRANPRRITLGTSFSF